MFENDLQNEIHAYRYFDGDTFGPILFGVRYQNIDDISVLNRPDEVTKFAI